MLERSSARYVVMAYLCDMVLTVLALVAARWLRYILPWGQTLDEAGAAIYGPMILLALVVWSISLATSHVYDPHHFANGQQELQAMFIAVSVATLSFAGLLYFSYRGLSRLLFLYFYLIDLAFLTLLRVVLRKMVAQRQDAWRRQVLIVGAGDTGREIAQSLKSAEWMGIRIVGYLDDGLPIDQGDQEGYPVLGPLGQARRVAAEYEIDEVIIALPLDAHSQMANLIAELQETPVNIKVIPNYSKYVYYRSTFEQFGGVMLMGLKEPVIGPIDRFVKRLFDLMLAIIGGVFLAPLMLVIAIAVKLGSPGPVLYKSRRIGEGRRPFDMLKFRTMVIGADQHESDLIGEENGHLVFRKERDDARITSVGRTLRRLSLDELPQIWNVIAGEMSLVGPRPELPALVERYQPWQRKRFSVPQGITGWWQISGRSSKVKYLHVEDDLWYIQNYSLLLDLRILWRTLGVIIRGEGAY